MTPEPIRPGDEPAILALNNLNATELSALDAARLRWMLSMAFRARRIGDAQAFMLAFDHAAAYDSPNYLWFRARYERFAYADRLAVASSARGFGHARLLYADLIGAAREAGHELLLCEVNSDPPNPASAALHASLGFVEVGSAAILGGAKTVRYLALRIAP